MNEGPIVTDQQVKPLEINIGEIVDLNQLPGIPELRIEVMSRYIPRDRVVYLRENFYPNFSYEGILQIERTLIFHFEKFGRIACWVQKGSNPKPQIEEFGVGTLSPLNSRLEVIKLLSDNSQTSTAFASLEMVEHYLQLPNFHRLIEEIELILSRNGGAKFVDVGCGGQAADIQLLFHPKLAQNVRARGITAFDYGERLRPAFPEISGNIECKTENIYTFNDGEQFDLVFSVRTLPYTGLIDAVRFLKALHDMASDDGAVWVDGVIENSFDFSDTEFSSLKDYLNTLLSNHPSLRYSNDRGDFVIFWKKSDGFPFERFIAKKLCINQETNLPYNIVYGFGKPMPRG